MVGVLSEGFGGDLPALPDGWGTRNRRFLVSSLRVGLSKPKTPSNRSHGPGGTTPKEARSRSREMMNRRGSMAVARTRSGTRAV